MTRAIKTRNSGPWKHIGDGMVVRVRKAKNRTDFICSCNTEADAIAISHFPELLAAAEDFLHDWDVPSDPYDENGNLSKLQKAIVSCRGGK